MKPSRVLIFLVVLMAAQAVFGQTRRRNTKDVHLFDASVLLGRSFSQIDGDFFTGFDKSGWYFGLRGGVNFSDHFSLAVEMLYSQKGSKIPHGTIIQQGSKNDRIIEFEYAEVPVILKYNLNPTRSKPFVELGVTYAKRFNSRIVENNLPMFNPGTSYLEIEDDFKSSDINFLGGFGYNINSRIDVTIRYTYAFNKFYLNDDYEPSSPFSLLVKEVEFLRNYHLTLLVSYRLI